MKKFTQMISLVLTLAICFTFVVGAVPALALTEEDPGVTSEVPQAGGEPADASTEEGLSVKEEPPVEAPAAEDPVGEPKAPLAGAPADTVAPAVDYDIGLSILRDSIPDQTYTGEALTPVPALLDSRDNSPINLPACNVVYKDNTNAGTATITVTPKASSGYTGERVLTFRILKAAPPKLSVKGGNLTKYAGDAKFTLTAAGGAPGNTLKWASSDKNVATVTHAGVVTPKGKGTATLTATSTAPNHATTTASIKLTVKQRVTSVKLNRSIQTVKPGKTYILKPTVKPANADNQKLNWTTSNKKIATVTQGGKVKGLKKGKVTIKATATDGSNKSAKATIYVGKPVKSITLNAAKVGVKKGKTVTLKATVKPSSAAYKKLKWTSSNEKVATVTQKGVVKGIKKGKASIKATAKDGSGKSVKATVYVNYKATKVQLSASDLNLPQGVTHDLSVTVKPYYAYTTAVKWTSSNTKVAKVSKNGVVTAVSSGTAIITATAKAGGKSAACTVTVPKPKPVVNTTAVSNVFYWVRSNMRYVATPRASYNEMVQYSLKYKRGACYHYAALTHYKLAQAGVSSTIIYGTNPSGGPHAWVQLADGTIVDTCNGYLLITPAQMSSMGFSW